jgi:hypothetical protein
MGKHRLAINVNEELVLSVHPRRSAGSRHNGGATRLSTAGAIPVRLFPDL